MRRLIDRVDSATDDQLGRENHVVIGRGSLPEKEHVLALRFGQILARDKHSHRVPICGNCASPSYDYDARARRREFVCRVLDYLFDDQNAFCIGGRPVGREMRDARGRCANRNEAGSLAG